MHMQQDEGGLQMPRASTRAAAAGLTCSDGVMQRPRQEA